MEEQVKKQRSKFNKYYYSLVNDETALWLKENDPNYSNQNKDKGLEYPYLTVRKELYRQAKELPISNVSPTQDKLLNGFLETNNHFDD